MGRHTVNDPVLPEPAGEAAGIEAVRTIETCTDAPADPAAPGAARRTGGRPGGRGFSADTVYNAVCDLIAEIGYERLTMDAVAARAQASKATLYRHWSGKPDLVAHAVKRRPDSAPHVPDTGNLRDDLRGLLRGFRDRIDSQDGEIFLGVVKAMQKDHELAAAMRDRVERSRCTMLDLVMGQARARGEVAPDTDGELPISAALAELSNRSLMRRERISDDIIDRLVDEVVLPGLTRGR